MSQSIRFGLIDVRYVIQSNGHPWFFANDVMKAIGKSYKAIDFNRLVPSAYTKDSGVKSARGAEIPLICFAGIGHMAKSLRRIKSRDAAKELESALRSHFKATAKREAAETKPEQSEPSSVLPAAKISHTATDSVEVPMHIVYDMLVACDYWLRQTKTVRAEALFALREVGSPLSAQAYSLFSDPLLFFRSVERFFESKGIKLDNFS